MRKLLRGTTRADKLLIAVLLLVSVSGIVFIQEVIPKGSNVLIEVDGHPLYVLPLGRDRVVEVEGPQGKTIVEINQGKVRVKDSPCPAKLCIKQGWIGHGVVVCLPNKVVVSIVDDSGDSGDVDTIVDAITR